MKTIVSNLLLYILSVKVSCASRELILVPPGNGQEFVYSPVDVNATLHCEVNHVRLTWLVGDKRYVFEVEDHRNLLHSRGIFQFGTMLSFNNTTVSNLILLGDVAINNNTRICCQATGEESCTTLVIYCRPFPPQQVSVKPTRFPKKFNLSWNANSMVGVDQNYTIVFSSHQTELRETYYVVHNLGYITARCGVFLAYVRAVNGAGESDPSNNVTIPSLPDIEPVTASLTHQVWKSNGQIIVNVSFEPATFCKEYPLKGYLLNVTSLFTGESFEVSLNSSETNTILSTQHGLEDNHHYTYTITAFNDIGMRTAASYGNGTGNYILKTADVRAVMAAIIDESTIEVQCHFIPGSDAMGCEVVLDSECLSVADEHVNISRSSRTLSLSKNLSMVHNTSCFIRVFAYDIDVNNTISNLSIVGEVKPLAQSFHTDSHKIFIAIAIPTTILLLGFVITAAAGPIIVWKRAKKLKPGHMNNTIGSEHAHPVIVNIKDPSLSIPIPQPSVILDKADGQISTKKLYTHSLEKCSPSLERSLDNGLQEDTQYAVPHKLRKKDTKGSSQSVDDLAEEHFYHVLEKESTPTTDGAVNRNGDTPCLPPPFDPTSTDTNTSPVYQDIEMTVSELSTTHQQSKPTQYVADDEQENERPCH